MVRSALSDTLPPLSATMHRKLGCETHGVREATWHSPTCVAGANRDQDRDATHMLPLEQ